MYDNLRTVAEQTGHSFLVRGVQGLEIAKTFAHVIGHKTSLGLTATLYILGVDEKMAKEFLHALRDDIAAGKKYLDIKPYVNPRAISSSLDLFWKLALIDGKDANATFNKNLFLSLQIENIITAKSYEYYFKFSDKKSIKYKVDLYKLLQEYAVSHTAGNNSEYSTKYSVDRVQNWNKRVDEHELFEKIGSPRTWKLGSKEKSLTNDFGSSVDPASAKHIKSPNYRDITAKNPCVPEVLEKTYELDNDNKVTKCCHSNEYRRDIQSPCKEINTYLDTLDNVKQTNVFNHAKVMNVNKDKLEKKLVNDIKSSHRAKEKKKSGVFKPITKFFKHAKYAVSNRGKRDVDSEPEAQHSDNVDGDEMRNNAREADDIVKDETTSEYNADSPVIKDDPGKTQTVNDPRDTAGTLILQIPANIQKIVLEKDGRRITVEI